MSETKTQPIPSAKTKAGDLDRMMKESNKAFDKRPATNRKESKKGK